MKTKSIIKLVKDSEEYRHKIISMLVRSLQETDMIDQTIEEIHKILSGNDTDQSESGSDIEKSDNIKKKIR